MSSADVIAGIAWDPQIRGFLAVLVGVVVLLGSGYLLLATNVGMRLGFLIAVSAFWGWLFLMGSVWWIYGNVGMLGQAPHWEVTEVIYPGTEASGYPDVRALDTSELPPPEELATQEEDDLDRGRPTSPTWTAGSSSPSRTPPSARPRRPSTSTSRPSPTRS